MTWQEQLLFRADFWTSGKGFIWLCSWGQTPFWAPGCQGCGGGQLLQLCACSCLWSCGCCKMPAGAQRWVTVSPRDLGWLLRWGGRSWAGRRRGCSREETSLARLAKGADGAEAMLEWKNVQRRKIPSSKRGLERQPPPPPQLLCSVCLAAALP